MNDQPFIDGRVYEYMCFVCYSTPKRSEYNPKTDQYDQIFGQLHSVQEMLDDGFNKQEAELSLKAMRKLVGNPELVVVSSVVIFDKLYMPDAEIVFN